MSALLFWLAGLLAAGPLVTTLALPAAAPAASVQTTTDSALPSGFVALPGTSTAVRLSGYLKLDAICDLGAYSGDASDLPNLPLGGPSPDQGRLGVTRLHARESRLALSILNPTARGAVLAHLETDFFGGGVGSTNHQLRMRHAYVAWQYLLAGQTWSNFLDVDARGSTVEFNGPTGAGYARHAQLRVSYRAATGTTVAVAVENGSSDYTDPQGNRVLGAQSLAGGDLQRLPDLTAQLRHQVGASHLALRAMARQLRVLGAPGALPVYAAFGHGVGLSGRWRPDASTSLYAQVNAGRGLGAYISDLEGLSGTFDASGTRFATLPGYGALVGLEHQLAPDLRSNLIATASGVSLPAWAPRGPGIKPLSTRFSQLFVNLIYQPIAPVWIGLEYGHFRRETSAGLPGWGHRVQVGIAYRFGG